jgi:hypothetical protein
MKLKLLCNLVRRFEAVPGARVLCVTNVYENCAWCVLYNFLACLITF